MRTESGQLARDNVKKGAFALLLLLPGCAQTTLQSPVVTIPQALRDCPQTPRPDAVGLTVGALASYSVQQEADRQICDARRAALVTIAESLNAPNPRKWWPW